MPGEKVYMVIEMMESRMLKEPPAVIYDLDDYRRGLRNRPNESEVTITPGHKVDLWTIQAGQSVPMHMHTNSECVMIVLAGQGEYRLGDRSYNISRDMLTIAPPGKAHGFKNTNTEPLVVLTIEGPGSFDSKVLEPMSREKLY